MSDLAFKLNVSIDDRTGRPRAAYLQVRAGEVAETREVVPGKAFADYSGDGRLLGVEFLAPCNVRVVDDLTHDEPEPVRGFFRGVTPRELLVA